VTVMVLMTPETWHDDISRIYSTSFTFLTFGSNRSRFFSSAINSVFIVGTNPVPGL